MNRFDFYREENVTQEKLQEIETEIKTLVGSDPDHLVIFRLSEQEIKRLEELFGFRCFILNNMFQVTPENKERVRKVNSHLKYLTHKLHERYGAMEQKAKMICDDPTFDDDYMIEGSLAFNYNSEDSVLHYEDDDYYGSDFDMMISALDQFYYQKGKYEHNILEVIDADHNIDDEMPWHEAPLNHEKYGDVDICYASHVLCSHRDYSLPDFIRMNDFWAEIHFREQSITGLDGKRYNPNDYEEEKNENERK